MLSDGTKGRPMRRFLAIGLLLCATLALPCPAAAQSTVAARLPSVIVTPKAAGDTLVVECDYNSNAAVAGAVSDSAGTAYSPAGTVNVSASGFAQLVAISAPLASTSPLTVKCPSSPASGEIYVVEMRGAFALDTFIATNGPSSPASASLPAAAGDTVLAFCITGACSNAQGWTTLSTFDSNLVASELAAGANVSGSFPTTGSWVLTLVALKPTAAPSPPPTPPPAPGTVIPSFACTPSFLPVTLSTFVPAGAKGLTFTVQNSDAANNLVITQITPPPGFAIDAVPAMPVTIAPGDSQAFTIRFVPPAAGTYTGNVVFLANVANGDFLMGVSGVAK